MKTATYGEGVIIALLASIIGSIGFFTLSSVFSEDIAIRLLISGLIFVYLLYLLNRSQERVGRVTTLLIWFIVMMLLWLLYPPLSLFVITHLLAIWLIRSLYFYTGFFPSLADLGLNGFSIAAASWACHHTGSVFLSIWCFFLVQAFFVALPSGNKQPIADKPIPENHEANFNRAYQAAEAAVRKLSSFN